MKYKAVIFDLDGTLVDTLADLRTAVNFALRRYGLPERSLAEVKSFVGDGVSKLVSRAVPKGTAPQVTTKALGAFLSYYEVHCLDQTAPYPEVACILQGLHGKVPLGVASNKNDSAMAEIVSKLFPSVFDVACGMSEGDRKKPAPDVLFRISTALGVEISSCVLVGDSPVDVATAAAAGCDMIGVSWGFAGRELLTQSGATLIVDTALELLRVLE